MDLKGIDCGISTEQKNLIIVEMDKGKAGKDESLREKLGSDLHQEN